MKNFVKEGTTITLNAPYAVTSGGGFLVGAIFAVAAAAAANGAEVEGVTEGVFDLPKATGAGTNVAAGAKAYWDNTNKVVTGTASGNTLIGAFVKSAATGDTIAQVRLNGSF